jgi:hypothetical protein
MKGVFFCLSFAFMLACLTSFSSKRNKAAMPGHDFADTASFKNMLGYRDSANTRDADTTHWITLCGTVTGKKTSYMYGGKREVVNERPLSDIMVCTRSRKYKTKTDFMGRFALKLPLHCSDALLVNGPCMYAYNGYSEKEIPLKHLNTGKPLSVQLNYWLRPWMIVDPCF